MLSLQKNKVFCRVICLYALFSFLSSAIFPNYLAAELILPAPNQFIPLSRPYSFPLLKGLKFNPANPFEMKFIIDSADDQEISREEATQLIRYFLACLTIPAQDIWVNMSPYEKEQMITPTLSATDVGRDLLAQDYILKQISASLTYPESDTGKDFWEKTYQEVLKVAKTTKLPVNTFNKIWLVPDRAVVYENEELALITEATLKAMLEEDYLALKQNLGNIQKQKKNLKEELIEKINQASSNVMREVILPKINEDVNLGKNFARLRQIYYALILATWFKEKFKESIYKYYINKGKVKGIDLADKDAKEKIYNLYVEAFQKGLYNYIRTDSEPVSRRKIKRQYFSGGFVAVLPGDPIIDVSSPLTKDNKVRIFNSSLGPNLDRDAVVTVSPEPILESPQARSPLSREEEINEEIKKLKEELIGPQEQISRLPQSDWRRQSPIHKRITSIKSEIEKLEKELANLRKTHVGSPAVVSLAKKALEIDGGDDYFIKPTIIEEDTDIKPGDSVIIFNFRGDRAEPITRLLTEDPDFKHFPLEKLGLTVAPFAVYNDKYFRKANLGSVVKDPSYTNTLGEVIAKAGKTQVRIAESEKFKHVTWFFDGLREASFEGMDTIQVSSNKIDKHWKQPEMKAGEIAQEAVRWVLGTDGKPKKDFVLVNLANLDILGHFDNFEAVVQGALVVDEAVGIIRQAVKETGGVLIVTADHGSGEQMAKLDERGLPRRDAQGKVLPHKAHAFDNKVPFIIEGIGNVKLKKDASLQNVAPTILQLLGVAKPLEMTADSLFEEYVGEVEGPVVVIVRDGWGISKFTNPESREFNAVYQASQRARDKGIKFNDDDLRTNAPYTELWAHGEYVGHPSYQMGDSENGHLSLGAGRQAKSTLSILGEMLASGEFANNPTVHKAIDNAKKGRTLHLIGMVSEGGVHSHLQHLLKLLDVINKNREGLTKIVLHPIFDGRDIETSEKPGWQDLEVVLAKVRELGLQNIIKIGVIAGRYYPMDRDALNRDKKGEPSEDLWRERVLPWYDAVVHGRGRRLEIIEEQPRTNSPVRAEELAEGIIEVYRASWDIRPPVGENGISESLKDTDARIWKYYGDEVQPNLNQGKNVLVVSHGIALALLLKELLGLTEEEVGNFTFPLVTPVRIRFSSDGKVQNVLIVQPEEEPDKENLGVLINLLSQKKIPYVIFTQKTGLPPEEAKSEIGELFLLRHAQPEVPSGLITGVGYFAGDTDIPLSETGKRQAESAGLLLRNLLNITKRKIDVAFTSDLARASDTCKIVLETAKQLEMPVRSDKRLRERNWGALSGKIRDEFKKILISAIQKLWADEPTNLEGKDTKTIARIISQQLTEMDAGSPEQYERSGVKEVLDEEGAGQAGSAESPVTVREITKGKWSVGGISAGIHATAYSPDGKYIAIGGGMPYITIIDTNTGDKIKDLDLRKPTWAFDFLPERKLFAVTDTAGFTYIFNTDDWSLVKKFQGNPNNRGMSTRPSRDGKYLAVGYDDSLLIIYDTASWKEVVRFKNYSGGINAVDFSSQYFAYVAEDHAIRAIKIDELASPPYSLPYLLRTLAKPNRRFTSLRFSPAAGDYLAVGDRDGNVLRYGVSSWRNLGETNHGNAIHSLDFSKDGKLLLITAGTNSERGNDDVILIDTQTGKTAFSQKAHSDYVFSGRFSPVDDSFITTAGTMDRKFIIRRIETAESPIATKATYALVKELWPENESYDLNNPSIKGQIEDTAQYLSRNSGEEQFTGTLVRELDRNGAEYVKELLSKISYLTILRRVRDSLPAPIRVVLDEVKGWKDVNPVSVIEIMDYYSNSAGKPVGSQEQVKAGSPITFSKAVKFLNYEISWEEDGILNTIQVLPGSVTQGWLRYEQGSITDIGDGKRRIVHYFYYSQSYVKESLVNRGEILLSEVLSILNGKPIAPQDVIDKIDSEILAATQPTGDKKPGQAKSPIKTPDEKSVNSTVNINAEIYKEQIRPVLQDKDENRNVLYEIKRLDKEGILSQVFPVMKVLKEKPKDITNVFEHTLGLIEELELIKKGDINGFNARIEEWRKKRPKDWTFTWKFEGKEGEVLFNKYRQIFHDVTRTPEDRELLYLIILLHDVGEQKKTQGHPNESARMIEPWLKQLGFSEEQINKAKSIIRSHVDLGTLYFAERTPDYLISNPESLNINTEEKSKLEEYLKTLSLLTFLDAGDAIVGKKAEFYAKVGIEPDYLNELKKNFYERRLNLFSSKADEEIDDNKYGKVDAELKKLEKLLTKEEMEIFKESINSGIEVIDYCIFFFRGLKGDSLVKLLFIMHKLTEGKNIKRINFTAPSKMGPNVAEKIDNNILQKWELEEISKLSPDNLMKELEEKGLVVKYEEGQLFIFTWEYYSVTAKLEELRRNSGLSFATVPSEVPIETSKNAFWRNVLRALHFENPVYRRVEREAKTEERYTGRTVFRDANEDTDITELTTYDVSEEKFYSIRKGEDVRGFILQPDASIPPEAYFMHRGIFASREDIQKAFYDNKIRFDITVIPPTIWGVDFAKTVGHYHDPVEMPEIYQVVSGEVLWLMQKTDDKGNVIDFITVRAKAGDIAIMLPGYGRVSVNLSETEPLVMANWLTWHQTSFYGSFKEKRGAAYYVVRNAQGKPELVPNPSYAEKQVLPPARQMAAKDEVTVFGLRRGEPIYNLLKHTNFTEEIRFLNFPQEYDKFLTPEGTLNDVNPQEQISVASSSPTVKKTTAAKPKTEEPAELKRLKMGKGRLEENLKRLQSFRVKPSTWQREVLEAEGQLKSIGEEISALETKASDSPMFSATDIDIPEKTGPPYGGIDLEGVKVKTTPASSPIKLPLLNLEHLEGFSFKIVKMEAIDINSVLGLVPNTVIEKKEFSYLR